MRVVIDTNSMVSAYLGGALKVIIVAWKSGKFTLVVSDSIANEYQEVLQRPKFQIEQSELDDFFSLLLDKAEFVIPLETINLVVDDPSDNKFLEAAIEGKVKLIVSGDSHLLDVKTFRNISIITAKDFIKGLKSQ